MNVNGVVNTTSPFVLRVERKTQVMKMQMNGVGSYTLVGYMSNSFPMSSGNCFSMYNAGGDTYKILNMNHENLEHLISIGKVTYPLEVDVLEDKHVVGYAVVCDERVPKNYLDNEYCSICCPDRLLPKEQRERKELKEKLEIAWGILKVGHPDENGFCMNQRSIGRYKRRANLTPKNTYLVRRSKRTRKVHLPRKINPTFSLQAMEDIRAMHSIDLKSNLLDVLGNECNDELMINGDDL